jgi:Glycosyl transferase family 2
MPRCEHGCTLGVPNTASEPQAAMAKTPELSVVLVGYRMDRELPRTIRSLSPAMQKGIRPDQYEVIVIDNGSPEPMPLSEYPDYGAQIFHHRFETTSASPAAAANFGLRQARGRLKGVLIDGARLASPGLLATALLASRLGERAVISSVGFHLGPKEQKHSVAEGYDQAREDALLDESGWLEDGYRLFDIATLAGSSQGGFFLPLAESNGLFMPSRLWRELGGFDERFVLPGGGYVNLDLYRRAGELPNSQLVVLLGEGTFHQVHGGVTTGAEPSCLERFKAEYFALRGDEFKPTMRPAILLGNAPVQAMRVFEQSARLSMRYRFGEEPFTCIPPLFDSEWYLGRYPDVREAGMDAAEHFLRYGQYEGRPWRP